MALTLPIALVAPGDELALAVRGCDVEVTVYANVEEARASLSAGHVAVLDGVLAGAGAAIERLCADGVGVLVVVDPADVMTAVRASNAGALDVLYRPLRVDELCARLRCAQTRLADREELRLRATTDALRRIIETAGEAIWILDRSGRTLYANARLGEMLGRSLDRLTELVGAELVQDHGRPLFVDLCERTLRGERATVEVALQHADGTEVWVSLRSTPLALGVGDRDVVLLVASDVTSRLRTENALRRGEARYRALVEAAPDQILILSPDGTIELSSRDGVVGSSFGDLVASEHRARALALIERALESGAVEAGELDVLVAGASRRHICRLRRIDGGFGPDRVVGFLTDVSEVQRVRAELEASQTNLVQSQRMEAVGRLAGGLAHDFNNVLSVVAGCASLIGSALHKGDPLLGDVQRIIDAAGRAETLTRQLLAFSRRQHLRPSAVDLGSVVRGMQRMLGRVLGEHILLRVQTEPTTPPVFVDLGQIEQVVLNLATNARDWMGTGGILTIRSEKRVLDGPAAERAGLRPGSYAALVVEDTGPGLTPAELAQVFEPFFARKAAGDQGLLLSSAYGIVQQSQGTIEATSTPGRGTAFTVLLPEHVAEHRSTLSPIPPRCDATILVVEDDEQVRYVILRALEGAGYRTLSADGPARALALIDELNPSIDLLVADVVMPGMSGAQLARCLEATYPEMPVLFVTGYLDETTLEHGLAHKAEALIHKPFAPPALVRRVTELLEGRLAKHGR